MKKITTLLLALFTAFLGFSQKNFENTDNLEIEENGKYQCSSITVSDVGVINDNYGLTKVCVIIESEDDGDLIFYLQSPDGTKVLLSSYNGGDGDDYGHIGWGSTSTCFTMSASTNITEGEPPYDDEFKPEGDLALINNFQNANGIWKLCIADTNDNNSEVELREWSLTFDKNPYHHITRITTCDTDWFDLGGNDEDYASGETHYWVFCPEDSTKEIGVLFDSWDVAEKDNLVFSNDTIFKQNYITGNQDVSLEGLKIRANNQSGCLTAYWNSDTANTVAAGWKAHISCFARDCQKIEYAWDGTSPTENDTNIIGICKTDELTASVTGIYPENDDTYHQDDASSHFIWNFGDGTILNGKSLSHTYSSGNIYQITLTIIDTMGCRSTPDLEKYVVRATDEPTFNLYPEKEYLYVDKKTPVLGTVKMPIYSNKIEIQNIENTDTLPLRDEYSYGYYYSNIKVNQLKPNEEITDASQIDSISLSLEHTWVGDLKTWLICPNGTEVLLFDGNDYDAGAGTYLGIPYSDDRDPEGPGVGWNYVFAETADLAFDNAPITDEEVTTVDGNSSDHSVKAGTYKPTGDFSDFVGCPLNGTWTIKIEDDQAADDGYLFNWKMSFVDSLYKKIIECPMEISDSLWTSLDTSDIDTTVSPVEIYASKQGENRFKYTITDQFGCSYDTTITIIGAKVEFELSKEDISCNGDNNGKVHLTITEGSVSKYIWENPDGTTGSEESTVSTKDWENLTAGTFTVTVEDADGYPSVQSIEIKEPDVLTASETHVDVQCYGNEDASINVTVNGGTLDYTFTWSGPDSYSSTEQNISSLRSGKYSLVVKDANDCEFKLDTVEITQPDSLVASEEHEDILCHGHNDGAIDLTVSGGTIPYKYDWDNDGTGDNNDYQDLSSLSEGEYNVKVIDAHNCQLEVGPITIEAPDTLVVSETHEDLKCYDDSNGSIDLTVTGGVLPYTYNWSGPDAYSSSDEDISSLKVGDYTITIKDNNDCELVTSVKINAPEPLSLSETHKQICYNSDGSGSIDITVSGGFSDYTYTWSGPDAYSSSDEDINSLEEGKYNVVVKDANDCELKSDTIEIYKADSIKASEIHKEECYNSSDAFINLTVNGGTPDYTFAWSGPDGFSSTEQNLSSLEEGDYVVVIKDASDCELTMDTISIFETDSLIISETHEDMCYDDDDDNTGSIDLTVSGGTPGYSFAWSGPDGFSSSEQSLSSLKAGDYHLTVEDANACQRILSPITIFRSDSTPPIFNIYPKQTYLHKDDTTILIQNTKYVYKGARSIEYSDTTVLPDGAGDVYDITVSVNSFKSTDTIFNASQIDSLSLNLEHSWVGDLKVWFVCPNGTEVLLFDGNDYDAGAGTYLGIPYSDDRDPEGPGVGWNYVFAETADLAFDTAPTTDEEVTTGDGRSSDYSVKPGTYKPTGDFSDFVGCPLNGDWIVRVEDDQSADNGYLFNWRLYLGDVYLSKDMQIVDSSWVSLDSSTIDTTVNPIKVVANKLGENRFKYTVTDQFGCSYDTTITIIGTNVEFELSKEDILCHSANTGKVHLTVTEGSVSKYVWENPDGTIGSEESTATEKDWENLTAGIFTVTVEDADGYPNVQSIEITESDAIAITEVHKDAKCYDDNSGFIQVSVSGGTPDYSYIWAGPEGYTSSEKNINSLKAGDYKFVVSDQNYCKDSITIEITEPDAIAITEIHKASKCYGDNSGFIQVSVSGGTPDYSYTWAGPEGYASSEKNINSLSAGSYKLVVSDQNHCKDSITTEITEPDSISISICVVTVDTATKTNLVVWERGDDYLAVQYNIYRKDTASDDYLLIDSVSVNDLTEYYDTTADPNERSWKYKMSVIDSCGNESALSEYHKTIHLVMTEELDNSFKLEWDDYEGINYSSVYIYRKIGDDAWKVLDSLSSDEHTYTDRPMTYKEVQYIVVVKIENTCDITSRGTRALTTFGQFTSNVVGKGATTFIKKSISDNIQIYPNPSKGQVIVQGRGIVRVEVITVNGKKIRDIQFKTHNKTSINLRREAKGLYFVKVTTKQGIVMQKIVLE